MTAHLAHWFPTPIEGERVAGAPLRFSFPGGQAPPLDGETIACEPQSPMKLRSGPDIVRLVLRATADGTELTLLDILEERDKAARGGAGGRRGLDGNAAALDGKENHCEAMGAWHDGHTHYVTDFGRGAATIGLPEEFE